MAEQSTPFEMKAPDLGATESSKFLEATQLLRLAAAQLAAARQDSDRDFEMLSKLLANLQRDYQIRTTVAEGSGQAPRPICSFGRTLLEALGTLQFHDLLRQRLDQIESLIATIEGWIVVERDDFEHLEFSDLLKEIRTSYVSEKQRSVHDIVFISSEKIVNSDLDIELF